MEHENLHHALLNMEKWLMIMRQKLESFCSPSGHWSVEGRRHEAEVGVGLFSFQDSVGMCSCTWVPAYPLAEAG